MKKAFLIILILFFNFNLFAQSKIGPVPYSEVPVSYSGDLANAVSSLRSVGEIKTKPGNYVIASDLSLPVGILFNPTPGAVFTINNGVTLTLNGPTLLDIKSKFFTLVGTGKVVYSSTCSIGAYYPYWYGAKGDSNSGNSYVGTNCTTAIQSTIDAAILNPRPIQFLDGIHYVNASLKLPDQTSNPYVSISIKGTNTNYNAGYVRGNCVIEFDGNELFESKTAFVATALVVKAEISGLCFYAHGSNGPTMFKNIAFSTGIFERNLTIGWGQIFGMVNGVAQISYNHFLGQRDSIINDQTSQYGADTWFHHNYCNGNNTLGTVELIKIYGSASYHIENNYFDFAKIGIFFYYAGTNTGGKATVRGNTFDILYRGIYTQQSNEISIVGNVFRRCNLASRATYMTANPATAWGAIELWTNSYNITVTGNNYHDVDSWITLTGDGHWNITDSANVGTIGAWPMIDWTAKTFNTGTYPLDGQRINSTSRGIVRKTSAIAFTVLPSDDYIVYTGAGGVAATLPRAYLGRGFRIYNSGAGTLTITPTGGDTCNVATLTTGQSKFFFGSGTVHEAN